MNLTPTRRAILDKLADGRWHHEREFASNADRPVKLKRGVGLGYGQPMQHHVIQPLLDAGYVERRSADRYHAYVYCYRITDAGRQV